MDAIERVLTSVLLLDEQVVGLGLTGQPKGCNVVEQSLADKTMPSPIRLIN